MTFRKGEPPGFYGTPSTSTLRFVRTSCPTKALWFFKAHLTRRLSQRGTLPGRKVRATGYEDSGFVFATGKGTPLDA